MLLDLSYLYAIFTDILAFFVFMIYWNYIFCCLVFEFSNLNHFNVPKFNAKADQFCQRLQKSTTGRMNNMLH